MQIVVLVKWKNFLAYLIIEVVMNVIDYIERHIMGFTTLEFHDDDDTLVEFTVQLRIEDVSWLENLLAPIV